MTEKLKVYHTYILTGDRKMREIAIAVYVVAFVLTISYYVVTTIA